MGMMMVIKMTMKNLALKIVTVMRMMRVVGKERADGNHQMIIPSCVTGRSMFIFFLPLLFQN